MDQIVKSKIRGMLASKDKVGCTYDNLEDLYKRGYETGFLDRDLGNLLHSKVKTIDETKKKKSTLILWQVMAPGFGIIRVKANSREQALDMGFYYFLEQRVRNIRREEVKIVGNVPEIITYVE